MTEEEYQILRRQAKLQEIKEASKEAKALLLLLPNSIRYRQHRSPGITKEEIKAEIDLLLGSLYETAWKKRMGDE